MHFHILNLSGVNLLTLLKTEGDMSEMNHVQPKRKKERKNVFILN